MHRNFVPEVVSHSGRFGRVLCAQGPSAFGVSVLVLIQSIPLSFGLAIRFASNDRLASKAIAKLCLRGKGMCPRATARRKDVSHVDPAIV